MQFTIICWLTNLSQLGFPLILLDWSRNTHYIVTVWFNAYSLSFTFFSLPFNAFSSIDLYMLSMFNHVNPWKVGDSADVVSCMTCFLCGRWNKQSAYIYYTDVNLTWISLVKSIWDRWDKQNSYIHKQTFDSDLVSERQGHRMATRTPDGDKDTGYVQDLNPCPARAVYTTLNSQKAASPNFTLFSINDLMMCQST